MKGIPHKLNNGDFGLSVSYEILEEYKRVVADLSIKFKAPNGLKVLDAIILKSFLTLSVTLPKQICADPDDDKFISAALSGKANLIVSGDHHLLSIAEYQGIKVITANQFLKSLL